MLTTIIVLSLLAGGTMCRISQARPEPQSCAQSGNLLAQYIIYNDIGPMRKGTFLNLRFIQ